MPDLGTRCLGLRLPHPVLPGAGPPAADLDGLRRLEDAGAPLVVLDSLFEEDLDGRGPGGRPARDLDSALERVRAAKAALGVPVVASLNGTPGGRWLDGAPCLAEAGADALELNLDRLPADPDRSSAALEARLVDAVRTVADAVPVPVAVKLSAEHAGLGALAASLHAAGARALVLFARPHFPDVDAGRRTVVPSLRLSDPSELPARLRWLQVLRERFPGELLACGGVHAAEDVVKALLAGASAVQVVSAVLIAGPDRIRSLRDGLADWMDAQGFESLDALRAALPPPRPGDPGEREHYLATLTDWRPVV